MYLLKHFKELTVRPKNAHELKGLILQLAVQGKLTGKWREENPDVKTATDLLKVIKVEKAKLIKHKKVRKSKTFFKVKPEEKYLQIPKNWEWSRLIEIGNLFNGNSVNKAVKEIKYEGLKEGFSYLGTKDVKYGFEQLNYENGVKIPFDEPKFKVAHKNTPLICSEGGSAGKKCGITNQDICFGNKLFALEQYGNIESIFILSLYQTPIFFQEFQNRMTGIIGGISINSFGEIPIAIPPLEEQKAIVEVVKTLLKEVEQLEQLTVERISLKEKFVTSALNQLTTKNAKKEWAFLQEHFHSFFNEIHNIKKLRETLLQLAVQGKLTADWRSNNPDTENASILLKRIQKEKAQLINDKIIKKEKVLQPITKDEVPYELPDGWVWCRMQDVFKDLRYGTSKKCDYKLGVNPVLRIPNLKHGGIDISDLKTTNLSEKELKDLSLSEGDLLIIRSNGSENLVGRSAVIVNAGIGYSFAGYLVRLQVFTNYIESSYLHTVLESAMIRTAIEGPLRTTSGVKNINSTEISRLIIPIPSKEEQKAIVQKVNALMGLCDGLEQEVQQSQEQIEMLMQSWLREVFEQKKELEAV